MTKKYGMVLSGGGAKGIYQLGVFNALKEFPIEIGAISGSSIGGINGYAYAAISNEELNKIWNAFSMKDFISLDDDWLDGLSDRAGLEKVLDRFLKPEDIFESDITIYNTVSPVIALTDQTGARHPEYMKLNGKSGKEVKDILLATSALPVLYSKVAIRENVYEDGGVADNMPVQPLYLDGYRHVIAVGLSEKLRVDQQKYPMEELIEIIPSVDIGGLLDGTMNFGADYKSYVKRLGYYDAKRVLNAHFGIDNSIHDKYYDSRQIEHEVRVDHMQREIDEKLDKLMKYL